MNTHYNTELGLLDFYRDMAAQTEKLANIDSLRNTIKYVKGVNQTLAMECEAISGKLITTSNPLGSYSVLPSRANYAVTMEELNNLQIGGIAVLIGIISALLWKFVSWFRKWYSGEDGDNKGDGDGGGSSNKAYVPPDRISTVITGASDVTRELEQIRSDLVASMAKTGKSSSEAMAELETIVTNAFEPIVSKLTVSLDDFINNSGPTATLTSLFKGPLKDAPTKLRDVFNKVEQIINTYVGTTDQAVRVAESDKLIDLKVDSEATSSFWYDGNMGGHTSVKALMDDLVTQVNANADKKSKVAMDLNGRVNNFLNKLKEGLQGTYEVLDVEIKRLVTEVEKDLLTKVKSLEQKITRDASSKLAGDDSENFIKNATAVTQLLGRDISAVTTLTGRAAMSCRAYATVVKSMGDANRKIIHGYLSAAKQAKDIELTKKLEKLLATNATLLKNSK